MKIISLIIAEKDKEYIDLLKKYIRETKYSSMFYIKTFSNKENLEEYLQKQLCIDILLTIQEFVSNINKDKKIYSTILLTSIERKEEDCDLPLIYKYQPLNHLIIKILQIYNKSSCNKNLKFSSDNKVKIITFCSTSGGNGKTTVAINLANNLILKDKKVLYLNLELFSSISTFFPVSGSNDMSKINYYIKTNTKDLQNKIFELIKCDDETKIEYLEPFLNPYEILDVTNNDMNILIDSIKNFNLYDYILVDLEIGKNNFFASIMSKSDYIIWLFVDNIKDINKNKIFIDSLKFLFKEDLEEIQLKNLFILNKYIEGSVHNNLANCNFNVFGQLPYIQEWKVVSDKRQILNNLKFNSKLNQLFVGMLE